MAQSNAGFRGAEHEKSPTHKVDARFSTSLRVPFLGQTDKRFFRLPATTKVPLSETPKTQISNAGVERFGGKDKRVNKSRSMLTSPKIPHCAMLFETQGLQADGSGVNNFGNDWK